MELENKQKAEILIGLFLVAGIAGWIFIPMVFAGDTIFLTTKDGGTPVSCAPANGLVLAQNLTDLCDVTIISPTTNQLIKYNGSQWVNVDSSSIVGNATCSNLGSGVIVCASDINNVLAFKSLVSSTGISITNDSDTITITNTLPEDTVCNNALDDNPNSAWCFDGDVTIRNIIASDGIFLDGSNADYIAISAYCTTQVPSAGFNLTTGCDTATTNIHLKNLLAGSGISLSANSTHVTITNNGVTSNVAGTGINVSSPTGTSTISTKFANGTGISITGTTTQTFTNTGVTSLTSANSQVALNASNGNVLITPKYQLLCQNTWSSGQSFSCSSFTAKTYLHVEIIASHANAGTGIQTALQFNNDTGNNYADRLSVNGAADTTGNTRANCRFGTAADTEGGGVYTLDITNLASKDKELRGQGTGFLNRIVGIAPTRMEYVCNWVNTVNQITTITVMTNSGNDNYDSNAKITVWGYD